MRLGPIALPICLYGRVSYLFHSIAGLGRRKRPNGLMTNLSNGVGNYRVGERGQSLVCCDTDNVAIGYSRSGIVGGVLSLLLFVFLCGLING